MAGGLRPPSTLGGLRPPSTLSPLDEPKAVAGVAGAVAGVAGVEAGVEVEGGLRPPSTLAPLDEPKAVGGVAVGGVAGVVCCGNNPSSCLLIYCASSVWLRSSSSLDA